ncbi:MAG: hypothetical protein KY467_05805 [Gemmatimonadetes bacterium]|nr:hypothetical protein [Gemmatimonadota bacterium]
MEMHTSDGLAISQQIMGIGLYTFYSIQHFQSAGYHAGRAKRLEQRYKGEVTGRMLPAIRAEAGSAIFASVAFLEATANELFAEALQTGGGELRSRAADELEAVSQLGLMTAVERASLQEKFEFLLIGARLEPLKRGEQPAQNVDTLIGLRNGLMHYKASWLDWGTDNMIRKESLAKSKLGRGIRGLFPARAHSEGHSDYWLGAGSARWALQSALHYADEIFRRLDVTPIYDHVRSEFA